MSTRPDTKVIAGIFSEEAAAAEAVKRLVQEHFDPRNDLGVIASHHAEREAVPVWQKLPLGRDAAIGAAVGAVLGGVGIAIAGLDFGPLTLMEGGALLAGLEGMFAGGCIGFALGALLGLDHAKTEADFESTHVHDGVVWVGVHASGERAELARRILAEAGAKHFMEREPRHAEAVAPA